MRHFRKILLTFFAVALAASAALAGPALQMRVTLTQPNGERFSAVKRGDEFMNWYETAGNYAVLKDATTGYWVFAKASSSGGLARSAVPYSVKAAAPSGATKNFAPTKATMVRLRANYTSPTSFKASPANTAATAASTWTSNPISGTREAIFIRVNFQDATFKSTSEDAKEQIWGDTHSVRRYYLDQSHGKLDIISADFGGVKKDIIEITMTSADYNGGKHPDLLLDAESCGHYYYSHINEVAFVTSVLKRTGLNFVQFDKNNDGIIEADELVVYLLLAGYEKSASVRRPSVWMHAWQSWVNEGDEHNVYVADDKKTMLGPWSYGGELSEMIVQSQDVSLPLAGGVVHELGHQLCKLPDLYDVNYVNDGLGVFSVMAGCSWGCRVGELPGATPCNFDAWSRKYLSWDTPQTFTPSGSPINLICGTPRNGVFPIARINSPRVDSTYEYILAEVRNPNASDWDGGISGRLEFTDVSLPASFKGGVLLLHIDERTGSGSLAAGNDFNVSSNGCHQGNMAIWADGDSRAENAGSGTYKSLWYAGNGTTPDTMFYGSRDVTVASIFSGVSFSSFSSSGEFVSVVASRRKTGGGCNAATFPLLLLLGALPLVLGKIK